MHFSLTPWRRFPGHSLPLSVLESRSRLSAVRESLTARSPGTILSVLTSPSEAAIEYAESIRGRGGIRTARTKTSGEHCAMDGKGFGCLSDMGSGSARRQAMAGDSTKVLVDAD